MAKPKWYSDGLCFECTGCGGCCTGAPGYVWVTPEEIRKIAEYLGQPEGKLGKKYVRRVRLKHSLTELSNGDCIFLRWNDDGTSRCEIYPVRPVQCRTWPFWDYNLKSAKTWAKIAKTCPGMDRGKLHSFDDIETQRKKTW